MSFSSESTSKILRSTCKNLQQRSFAMLYLIFLGLAYTIDLEFFILKDKCVDSVNITHSIVAGFKVQKGVVADPALQAEWSKKKLVWVPHETEGFVAGMLKEDRGDDAVVELVDNGKVAF